MLILTVSIFTGFSVFALLYIATRKLKNMDNYQTKVRLQSLSEVPLSVGAGKPATRNASPLMLSRDLASMSFKERIITPLIESAQNFFMKLAPHTIFGTIERYIVLAGKQGQWRAEKIILVWDLTIMGFFLAGLVVVAVSDLLLDLLSVSVQAGLSLDASIERILPRWEGPLPDEFRQMQKDMRLGLSKKEALREMAGRCDLEEIYLFTTSVIQAERLGTSMGKALIEQATNMREWYQQKIKAQALKAPIKILFPLVLFIFPAVFIIILLPPLINVLNNLNIIPR